MEKLIIYATELMQEQIVAYQRLIGIHEKLTLALVHAEIEEIEIATRNGEKELLGIRLRLSQITNTLSSFTLACSNKGEKNHLESHVRSAFEKAYKELIKIAQIFQNIGSQIAPLAINGIAFANACSQVCGIQSNTYQAPYMRRTSKYPK